MVCRVCTGFSNLGEVAVCEGQRYEGTVASLSVPKGPGGLEALKHDLSLLPQAQHSPPSPGKEGANTPSGLAVSGTEPTFLLAPRSKGLSVNPNRYETIKNERPPLCCALKNSSSPCPQAKSVEKETNLVVEENKTEAQDQGKEEKRLAKLWRTEQRMLNLKRK
ncbi:hypothetical protein AOLI_G00165540 [Acnodon oligacanthus]